MSVFFGRKAVPSSSDVSGDRSSWSYSTPGREGIGNDFESYVAGALKRSGPVAACIAARQFVFAEATFQFRARVNGRPAEPFDGPALRLLERPWPGASTGDLLSRMEVDASLAGNSYHTLADDKGRVGHLARGPGLRIARLRPDWVYIIINSHSGDPYAADAQVVGYEYRGHGTGTLGAEPVLLLAKDVAHYSPMPDPTAMHRGMSWLTPVLEEVEADKAATRHKRKFFDRGASPKTVVSLPRELGQTEVDLFKATMAAQHDGVDMAYKTLYMTGGADVKTVGADLRQLDFKATQGAGETRICAAARVPVVIAGLSEGLSGSSLNEGNFSAARRLFAEGTVSKLWKDAASALERLVPPPGDARLWADTRDIPFLREDAKDLAEIQGLQARTVRTLLDAGFDPDAAVSFVRDEDLARLIGQHSGLFSVQLQEPGSSDPAPEVIPAEGGPA